MRKRLVSLGVCLLLVLGVVELTGCSVAQHAITDTATSGGAAAPTAGGFGPHGGYAGAPAADSSVQTASSDRLVIKTASMDVEVADLAGAIASIRSMTESAGGEVSDLTLSNDSGSQAPVPAHAASEAVPIPGPASAELTLRIPAPRLAAVVAGTGALGRVKAQTSNESDVTQKHIDLSARLVNSKAELARLRTLLNRAGSVSDLLQVEREMSRVQGDVESMTQQLAYLDSQIEMATLTVSLDEPGPIVPAWAGGWGFPDAVTQGIQGAADLLRGMITMLLTLSPVIVLAGLAWWFIAWRVRRRRARRGQPVMAPTQPQTLQTTAAETPVGYAQQPPSDRQG